MMQPSPHRGFSLIEVMITVSVVGVVAFLATITASNVMTSTQERKLISDVESLNRSVAAFLASGGDLSKAQTADDVLEALKLEMENASRVPGFGGAKVDDRVTFEYQSEKEAGGSSLRAYWDGDKNRFVLAESGEEGGIKGLGLSDRPVSRGDSDVKAGKASMLYAEEGNWIWDYADGVPLTPPGPTDVPLGSVPDTTPVTPPGPSGPGPGAGATPLTPPTFSLASGSYSISSFNLPLTLSNPNPSGSSDIYYSIDFGNWNLYTGSLQVHPGAVVAAQAIATTTDYQNSARVDESYEASPIGLIPPVISPSQPLFGLFTNRTLTVTITDLNPGPVSKIQYRIGGDPWQDYTGSFSLDRSAYPSGAMVEARAVPTDPYYLSSSATLRTLGVETATVAGASVGSFSNPIGEKSMETNLAGGVTSDYFEWGKVNTGNAGLAKSWLDYDGLAFANITGSDRFQIGVLNYFNGSILTNSGATEVSFAIDLDFDLNGVAATSTFDFDLELVNVVNKGNDKWEDADYVRLANPIASQIVTFNGLQYQLQIEFGETSASGISYFNEFHVVENEQASTRIYGTLVEVGTVSFNN